MKNLRGRNMAPDGTAAVVSKPTGDFLKHRFGRIFIPFVIWAVFLCRLPTENGWPIKGPLSLALDLELGWRTCTIGVAMTATGAFLIIRKFTSEGALYRYIVKPLASASYGTYLAHMLVLTPVVAWIRPNFSTPITMVLSAIITFALTSLLSLVLSRIPVIGRFLSP
jgi:hypothetical protein